jgi:hypothetical protein
MPHMPQMEPDTIYRLSEITVNADELRRLRDDLDEHLASGLALWRRVDQLIKQGTTPTKHANEKETKPGGQDPRADIGQKDTERNCAAQDDSPGAQAARGI